MKQSALSAQSCQTICDPMDCSPPGSSVHGILQARILQWVAIPFSRGFFPIQGLNAGLLHCRQFLYHLYHQGSIEIFQYPNNHYIHALIRRVLNCHLP